MTDTPRTDAQDGHPAIWHGETSDEKFEILYDAMTNHARALERELAEERQRTAFLELNSTKASIKLIDAGIAAFGTNEEAIGLLAGKRDEIAAYAEALKTALHELVRLKSIKDWLDVNEPARLAPTRDYFAEGRREEYDRCKEPAWAAARAALAENRSPSASDTGAVAADATGPVGLGPGDGMQFYRSTTERREARPVGGVFGEPDPLPIRYDERGNPLPIPGLVEPPLRTVGEGLTLPDPDPSAGMPFDLDEPREPKNPRYAEEALQSLRARRWAGSGNYTANDEVTPTKVTFANGRTVEVRAGILHVGNEARVEGEALGKEADRG